MYRNTAELENHFSYIRYCVEQFNRGFSKSRFINFVSETVWTNEVASLRMSVRFIMPNDTLLGIISGFVGFIWYEENLTNTTITLSLKPYLFQCEEEDKKEALTGRPKNYEDRVRDNSNLLNEKTNKTLVFRYTMDLDEDLNVVWNKVE